MARIRPEPGAVREPGTVLRAYPVAATALVIIELVRTVGRASPPVPLLP
ncbi:hypothetical protein ACFRAR_02300 [Kitasatospora sp. NPDC056651]